MTDPRIIIDRIDSLCDQFGHYGHGGAQRERDERILKMLQQAINDYFAIPQDPPTLGVNVSDPLGLEDKLR